MVRLTVRRGSFALTKAGLGSSLRFFKSMAARAISCFLVLCDHLRASTRIGPGLAGVVITAAVFREQRAHSSALWVATAH